MNRILLVLVVSAVLASSVTLGGGKDKAVFKVKGMHCPSCVSMIKKTVKKIDGVEEVGADVESGEVSVLFDPARQPLENVVKAINTMGYKVVENDSTSATSPDSSKSKIQE